MTVAKRSLKKREENLEENPIIVFLEEEEYEPLVKLDKTKQNKSEYELLKIYKGTKRLIPKERALAQWSHHGSVIKAHDTIVKSEFGYNYFEKNVTINSTVKKFDRFFFLIQQFAYVIKKEQQLLCLIHAYVFMSQKYTSMERTKENSMYMVTRKILLRRWMYLVKSRTDKLLVIENILLKEESVRSKKQKHLFWGNDIAPTHKEKMLLFHLFLKHLSNARILHIEKTYQSPKSYSEKWHAMIIQYEKMLRGIE